MTEITIKKAFVCFDARCGLCSRWARLLHRWRRRHGVVALPRRHRLCEILLETTPPRDRMAGRTAAGEQLDGWELILALAAERPRLRGLARLAGLPGLRQLGIATYDLLARHRYRLFPPSCTRPF